MLKTNPTKKKVQIEGIKKPKILKKFFKKKKKKKPINQASHKQVIINTMVEQISKRFLAQSISCIQISTKTQ